MESEDNTPQISPEEESLEQAIMEYELRQQQRERRFNALLSWHWFLVPAVLVILPVVMSPAGISVMLYGATRWTAIGSIRMYGCMIIVPWILRIAGYLLIRKPGKLTYLAQSLYVMSTLMMWVFVFAFVVGDLATFVSCL